MYKRKIHLVWALMWVVMAMRRQLSITLHLFTTASLWFITASQFITNQHRAITVMRQQSYHLAITILVVIVTGIVAAGIAVIAVGIVVVGIADIVAGIAAEIVVTGVVAAVVATTS
jgi:hypothetical protein